MKEHHHHVIMPHRKRAPPPKLKLLVCFNGAFSRFPPSQKLRYSGGETRIISVDPSVSFSRLESRIITDVVRASNGAVSRYSLKYHISESFCFGDGKDGPLLISLETDDDVRSMVEECEAVENLGKRVWVYVFDNHRRRTDNHRTGVTEGFSGIPAEQGFRWVEGFLREDLVAILRRKGGGNRSKRFGDDCLRKTVLRQQLLAKTFDDQVDEQMEIELVAGGGGDGDCGAPLADSFSDKSLNSWPDHVSPVKHSHNPPLNSKGGSLKRELEPCSFENPILSEPVKLPKNPGDIDKSEDKDHQGMCEKGLDDEENQDIQLGENRTMTAIPCLKAAGFSLATGELQNIKNSDLEFIKELGSGNFGTVYHGKWKGSDVAIKQIKSSCFTDNTKEMDRLVADFWKEAHILGQLRHPNIVAIYGVSSDGDPNSLAAVTEYMVNGSLKKILRRKDGTIDRRKRLILAMDATSGMEYLHEKNVIHFDLKSDNFLVNMKDPLRPVCKIGDLGLSKVKQRSRVSGGVRGTLPWMAPELLNGDSKVSEKVDVYSFGIVMWELLTGEVPHKHMRSEELIGGVIRGDLRPEIPAWCDPAWRSLMESCWSAEPESRPPFSEIAKQLRVMANAMKIK